ncbi:MAG: ATP-binding protein [Deltaproteobacteria bacterium]|jgi:SpoVK/Ycf46/Vps4 family AAA+-type ATPase|nr:ATP-binding protein [Deltaproteobacteria bacterium]
MDKSARLIMLYYLKKLINTSISCNIRESVINKFLEDFACKLFRQNLNSMLNEYLVLHNINYKNSNYKNLAHSKDNKNMEDYKWIVLCNLISSLKIPDDITGLNRYVILGDNISDNFNLSGLDRQLIRLMVLSYHIEPLFELMQDIGNNKYFSLDDDIVPLFMAFTGANEHEIRMAFHPNSPLIKTGLFYHDFDGDIILTDALKKMIYSPKKYYNNIKDLILEKNDTNKLTKNDFQYISDDYDFMLALLSAALDKKAEGVNLLLYGAPGVGKTEAAKTLAKGLGAKLYTISVRDSYSKSDRLAEIVMAQSLLRGSDGVVLLFDEAEDIFSDFIRESSAKLTLNRLLEENSVPTIWIANSLGKFQNATLRRFSFAYEMGTPPVSTMGRIWEKELKKNHVSVRKSEVDRITLNYPLPPSYAASAVKVAAITGDQGTIVRTLESLEYAINKRFPIAKDAGEKPFNYELVNADLDLERLSEQILEQKLFNFSLCLYGPPGTGKSAFVRVLAKKIGKKVLERKASDLLSKYVGHTEQLIAESFKMAQRRDEFLVFDEADSFLLERSQARRSWEVSHTNEMLEWMDVHPLPFACTSNLLDKLDKACLRRFSFKVRFDYLTQAQVRKAYRYFFGLDRSLRTSTLTVADFALALKKSKILGVDSPSDIDELLLSEARAKGESLRQIGF